MKTVGVEFRYSLLCRNTYVYIYTHTYIYIWKEVGLKHQSEEDDSATPLLAPLPHTT